MTKLVCFSWLGDFGVVVGLSDNHGFKISDTMLPPAKG